MPTNDERGRVAESLRQYMRVVSMDDRTDYAGLDISFDTHDESWFMDDLLRLCGLDGDVRVSELFERFADLIGPGQERESHVTREPDSDVLYHCDACGSYYESRRAYPYEFCPRCGAKVQQTGTKEVDE